MGEDSSSHWFILWVPLELQMQRCVWGPMFLSCLTLRMLELPASSAVSGLGFCSVLCSDLDLVNLQAEVKGLMESKNLGPCRVEKSNCFNQPKKWDGIFKRFWTTKYPQNFQLDRRVSEREQVREWDSYSGLESSASEIPGSGVKEAEKSAKDHKV